MKKKILIATALFTAACALQLCGKKDNTTTTAEMDSLMSAKKMQMDHSMMQSMGMTMGKMKVIKMTGDFDLDFASMMIMHHQAAIDMSEVEIAKGTDEHIKTMARNIITAQKEEIVQLNGFINNYKRPEANKNTEMHDELTASMKTMMDTMDKTKMTDNTDRYFAMLMIPHHEGAVTMAKDELRHGKQSGLLTMAQKMITDQTKEINEFEAWLSANK